MAICYSLNNETESWIYANQGKAWDLFLLKYRQELGVYEAKHGNAGQVHKPSRKRLKMAIKIIAPIVLLPLLALVALWIMRTLPLSNVMQMRGRFVYLHPSLICMAIGLALLLPLYLPLKKMKNWSKPKLILFIIALSAFTVAVIFATLFLMIFIYKPS